MQHEAQRLRLVVFYAFILLLAYLAYRVAQPFLVPLAWAGILALCAQPIYQPLQARRGPVFASAISTIAVALLLIGPAIFLTIALVREATVALGGLQDTILSLREHERTLRIWAWIEEHAPLLSREELSRQMADRAATLTRYLAGQAGVILQTSSVFAFKVFITLFALFFFLRDGPQLARIIRKILPFEPRRNDELISRTREMIFAGTLAMLTVAAIQGLAGGLMFAAFGLRAPVFWGVVMGFLALLPMFGTSLVWAPAGVAMIINGSWARGTLMLVIGLVVVGGVDNLLRPMLVSGRASMNGLVVFISLFGGVLAFGFLGLVLGPVIAAAVISLLELQGESGAQRAGADADDTGGRDGG